ncbi:MAG: helix-turn-helix domain-containing protein [Paracoccus sp. (in: a-proteobacteria)]
MIHSSAKFIALVAQAELGDAKVRRLLEPFDISLEEFKDVDSMFSTEQVLGIFRALLAHITAPDIIYDAGQRFQFTDFGIFGLAVMSQSDLRSGLQFAQRYRPFSSPLIGLDVHETQSESALIFSPLLGKAEYLDIYPRLLDFNIGMFISLIADAIGRDDFVSEILLSDRTDAVSCSLLRERKYVVTTGAHHDMVMLKPFAMDAPLRMKSTVGATIMAKALYSDAMASPAEASKFVADVQAVIIANVDKPLTASFVARRLGIGERSLRRRLSEENCSFRKMKLAVQDDIACRYLRETQMRIEEIATSVGYSDVANFRRAFKEVHGVTPYEFRRTS